MPGGKKPLKPKSQKQRALAGAAAAGRSRKMSPAVGREMLRNDPGGRLPKRIRKRKR